MGFIYVGWLDRFPLWIAEISETPKSEAKPVYFRPYEQREKTWITCPTAACLWNQASAG